MQTKMTAKDLKYGGIAEPRIKPTFLPLPPGAVEPRGWLRDWAVTARDGLSGHMDELSPTFRDGWKGTSTEANEDRNDGHYGNKIDGTGGILCESAYWLDGALRLGYLLHDQALIDKITKRLLPIVEGVNQGGDSFIYWRKGKPDNGFRSFSHSHLGRALVTWYRATGDKRILDALVRAYTNYPVPLGHLQFEADISGIENLDPLLEAYAFSGDQRLLDLAKTAMADPEAEATLREWGEGKFITGHGVGASEHIRLPILLYPWTGEGKYRQASVNGFQYFAQEHMLPYGVTSAEEWLAGIGAFRLTETCDVSEQLWTSSWMYRILGERVYGDGMERAFFNAGPGPVARDFKTMSYLQSPNRLSSKRLPVGWNPDCLVFVPFINPSCCAGAVHRILPTYITHMWMATQDQGLAATLYGPCAVTAVAGDKTWVRLTCETSYPFEETIRILVEPENQAEFPLYFRLPAWCAKPQISVNGKMIDATAGTNGFALVKRLWNKGDIVDLAFPMSVQVACGYEREYPASSKSYFGERPSANYAKRRLPYETVSYGPLLFALPIPDQDANTPMPDVKWQYALDNDAQRKGNDIEVERKPMPTTWAWQLDAPIALKVPAQAFDWKPTEAQALPNTTVPRGKGEIIRLVPYGCTKFRISMFPVTDRAFVRPQGTNTPVGDVISMYEVDLAARTSPFISDGWAASALIPPADVKQAPYHGLADDLGWDAVPNNHPVSVDVHKMRGPVGLVYLARKVKVAEAGEWILHVGHEGDARVFVDGKPVIATTSLGPICLWWRRTQARLALAAGEHEIVVALDRDNGNGKRLIVSFEIPEGGDYSKRAAQFPEPVRAFMVNEFKASLETYAADTAARLMKTDWGTLAQVGELLLTAKAEGRTVFLMGNGGSATTASHVTNDLVKGCRTGDAPGFRALCLSDSNALVTCLANDFSYEEIYTLLLRTYAKNGDVVLAFSGSGNSPNIVHGLKTAKEMGLVTVGFGGRDGGKMKALCDMILIAPTDFMEMIEDMHLIYFHDLVCAMRPGLAKLAGVKAAEGSC